MAIAAIAGCGTARAPTPAAPASAPPPAVATAPACPPAPECPPARVVELPCPVADAQPIATTGDDRLALARARFADLPGWADDRHAEALPALLASCAILTKLDPDARVGAGPYGGRARQWRRACRAAARVPAGDDVAARAMFEREFVAYAARGDSGADAKFTGYFVQQLDGARTRGGRYQTPILARPPDLVSVSLSEFVPDGRERRIWGRVDPETGALVAYPTRAEINAALRADPQRYPVLLWVDDPVDALFADIEGSGKVVLDDGSVVWIAFAGKNGHRFRGVGGILRGLGELGKGEGTMQGIRAWFEAHPERFDEIADLNPSRVFFVESPHAGGLGTQGVVLTPGRSMAVDRAVIPLSTPVWVSTRAPTVAGGPVAPWQRLVVAQDTGGAILGPVRGDLYFGDDEAAADVAGRMSGRGRMWLLLPRAVRVAGATAAQ